MEISVGKKTEIWEESALGAWLDRLPRLEVDLGTGDGAYPYRQAGLRPEVAFLGIDPARENLAPNAGRAQRKPAKGGRANLLYMIASMESLAESLPVPLVGRADRLTVLFPWGSLLGAVARAEAEWLALASKLSKPGTEMEILLNLHAFADDPVAQRLELPELDDAYLRETLAPRYAEAGWRLERMTRHAPNDLPTHTRWGRRLALGSGRETLRLGWSR